MTEIVGIVVLAIASIIGGWRQQCIFIEKNNPYELPRNWRGNGRYISLLIVIAISLYGALLVVYPAESSPAKFMFGVILFLRWLISIFIGYKLFIKYYPDEFL